MSEGKALRRDRPLVLLGPTAAGKSALALALVSRLAAEEQCAELVSIDSMQVYVGMNVGTASPTAEERAVVPHHLVDIASPTEEFTVAEFQLAARAAIADICARGAVPILVGGTGLYLRAVIDDLELPGRFPEVAAELCEERSNERLYRRLTDLDPVAASRMEPTNRRRILRALEVTIGSGRPFSSFGPGLGVYQPTPFVQFALRWPRPALDRRIADRYDRQMAEGFLDEVEALRTLGPSRTAGQALGYRELLAHLNGECSEAEALERAIVRTRRFARRQERWFRRDPRIIWIDAPADPVDVLTRWDAAIADRAETK